MTHATKITLLRLFLVPVFAKFAIDYADSWKVGEPQEPLRWLAVAIFVIIAASDGLDGWIARRFSQQSLLGAILDPLTDKALLLTGLIVLSLVEWGHNWHLPLWFIGLVIGREILIIVGIWILYGLNRHVPIKPHWTGKVCTVTQMFALGWIMLKIFPFPPLYPTILAAIFTIWSGVAYFHIGIRQLPSVAKSRD